MSPRPRLASDAEIVEAAKRVISREGPNGFTLAEVGREAGLAPATLVQRFGSKRGLMLAVAGRGAGAGAGAGMEAPESCFAAARRETSSPLEALMRGLEDMANMAPTPEELSNHLAFLQIDLTDPDFHALALANALTNRKGIIELLDEAIAAEELRGCDTHRLSVAVDAIAGGALINWAIHREGTAREAIHDALETLLGPYRVGGM